ncbi:MAG: zinc ribbon domain-containing protein [Eubacterium sp.]|nr:zinc ribbon domain-containing protein [Eubacterium sp.]
MKCKNCGAKLSENAVVCPNCGARIDNNDEYVLLTSDDMMFDIYADTPDDDNFNGKKKKKTGGIIWFLSILLTLAIIGGGAYYYFANIYNPTPDKPVLTFEGSSGIINDDEEIVYVLLKEDSKIEYIHGVSIYDYDKTDKNTEEKEAVSTDYEYTKNIDSTFRAIFFDIKDINAKKGKNVYTFEMKFSFYDSDEIYTYLYPVSFTSEPNSDIADLIFDHSEEETTLPSENNQQNEDEKTTKAQKTTKLSKGDYSFIYNFYWYTEPVQNGDEYSISALKLNRDNTYVSTSYFKNGDSSWQITTSNGKYKIENGFVVIDNGEATESTYYKIDTDNNSLFEEENGKKAATLSSRKYNSIKNAEDFFGI